jgi:8-oxo-dGTP diphosphatase
VICEPGPVLGARRYSASGRHVTCVACQWISGEARVQAPDEIAGVAWCTPAELAGHTPAGIAPFVRNYLDRELRRGTPGT